MLHAGKIIAATAIEATENPEIIEKAKAELRGRLNGEAYECPTPGDVKPPRKTAAYAK